MSPGARRARSCSLHALHKAQWSPSVSTTTFLTALPICPFKSAPPRSQSCSPLSVLPLHRDDLGRVEGADFVLAFWVVHEVDDPSGFLTQIRSFLKPRGLLFIAEPRGHVTSARFGMGRSSHRT